MKEATVSGAPQIGIDDHINIEKFAKLIIDECIRVCSDMANASPEPMRYMECEMAIEDHFKDDEY